jgi:redox-sensitive bicupin YhaK (pirin superfamily)
MKIKEKALIEIRKRNQRFRTRTEWLDSWHSFSFGRNYDPNNVGHGLLIVNNDDIVLPRTGFITHPHQDMEILTCVLAGELEHKDSEGNNGIIYPGLARRMSAGTGIWHSEINPNGKKPVRFIQMWVLPDTERIKPGYKQ